MVRVALTLRVDERMHEQLKAHAYLTGEAINETVGGLIGEYLAGPGREKMTKCASEKSRVSHRIALDALGVVQSPAVVEVQVERLKGEAAAAGLDWLPGEDDVA